MEAGKSLVEREVPEPLSKTLENADVLFQKGSDALKADDFTEAIDCLSRALEIRVAHYSEVAPECALTYYKYGSALLYKVETEADPLNESVALAQKKGFRLLPKVLNVNLREVMIRGNPLLMVSREKPQSPY
eukprot:Gb_04691 [translate_table: standard]